jgi:glycosyltransferase involved in cell wall biosynthesis
MENIHIPKHVALIGNFPPRQCGIATFTGDVHSALIKAFPDMTVDVYAMNDPGRTYAYPEAVVATIDQDDTAAYLRVARQIAESGADLLCVQHEYGIFGGPAGSYLLTLLDAVDIPVVVTLHTVLEYPNADQRAVIDALARRADRLVVMAEKGRALLRSVYGISGRKVVVVPHGVPDRPLGDGVAEKERFDLAGHRVMLTFGLLSPNKGIETMIRALPAIVTRHPDALYVVLGATHPHLVAHEGEAYRGRLQALAAELGMAEHVRFIDGFLDQETLLDWLTAADLYVTPYLCETQITSGTLSYAVALGRPVVSSPYWHAAELVPQGCGLLAAFGDEAAFSGAILELFGDGERCAALSARAYALGRTMIWSRFAERYGKIFADSITASAAVSVVPPRNGPYLPPSFSRLTSVLSGPVMARQAQRARPMTDTV